MTPLIFREYDIRARVGTDLTTEGGYRLGQALGTHFRRQGKRWLVVARDCRTSSLEWGAKLVAAHVASGGPRGNSRGETELAGGRCPRLAGS